MVSVIITTHNRAPGIVLRAVRSVLAQTYDAIEIIVVDDSTGDYPYRDEVERAVRQESAAIRYIRHEENRGACAARNTGLSYASGCYVAFLDDDDEWDPEKIEEQLKGFTDERIALVYCGVLIIDDVTGKKKKRQRVFQRGFVFDSLLQDNFIGGSSNPLIRKVCVDQVGGFDETLQSFQDFDLWLRIALRYPVNYVEKTLLYYHVHDGVRISTDPDKKIQGIERINEKYRESIAKDRYTWYMRYRVLVPFYREVYGPGRALSVWIPCLMKQPLRFFDNTKQLLRILVGNRVYKEMASQCQKLMSWKNSER